MTYYKIDDQTWITFSDMDQAYRITSDSDELLLDVSEAIDLIDESYIKSKLDHIPTSCQEIIDTKTKTS